MGIQNLDEFMNAFPDHEYLEAVPGFTRYSNGLGEGSHLESVWFCDNCDRIADKDEGCENCGNGCEGSDNEE